MSKYINLAAYPLAHPPVVEWIRANGLDPKKLPRDQVVEVRGEFLWGSEFVFTQDGHKQMSGAKPLTATFVTPLISTPETHGL